MSSLGKDSITCHVLDTTAGRPAKGISVQLEGPITSSSFSSSATPHPPNQAPPSDAEPVATAAAAAVGPSAQIFEATTDDDGRIRLWKPLKGADGGQQSLPTLLAGVHGASRWMLRFDTASYFGEEKTFFPEATVVFRVEEGQTYHVPLLLSPYSYTTYRGS